MSDSVSIGFCRLRRCLRRTQPKRVKLGELAQWITTRRRDTGYAVSERALTTHRAPTTVRAGLDEALYAGRGGVPGRRELNLVRPGSDASLARARRASINKWKLERSA